MELTRISATKFKVYAACPSRYEAEYIKGGKAGSSAGVPALTGSAVHAALEEYVKMVYVDKTDDPRLELLIDLLGEHWESVWKEPLDAKSAPYKDAVEMLKTWHERTDLSNVTVLSTEYKAIRTVEVPGGTREFTYIFDRCDYYVDEITGERVIRVVDYKTFRLNRGFDEVRKDLQMRMYAVGAMLDYAGQCDRVEVQMDLLRHSTVTATYSVEEIREFYVDMWEMAGKILADDTAEERLNSECIFCVKRSTCTAVRSNAAAGGVQSLIGTGDVTDLLEAWYEVDAARKAAEAAKSELDDALRATLDAEQVKNLTGGGFKASARENSRRNVDPSKAAAIVPPQVFAAAAKVSITALDKAHKAGEIDEDAWNKLNAQAVSRTTGAASVSVKKA